MDYKKNYIGKNLNQLSQLGNTLIDGEVDISISGRIGYNNIYHYNWFWGVCQKIVDFAFYPLDGWGHCYDAYKNDKNESYNPGGSFIALVILISLVTIVCIPLSVLSWAYLGIKLLIKYIIKKLK